MWLQYYLQFIVCVFSVTDILPLNEEGYPVTKEFLQRVVDVLMDWVKDTHDRSRPVLEFHHPDEMWRLIDLEIPDQPVTLQKLIDDCALTLKYQVKTGMYIFFSHEK